MFLCSLYKATSVPQTFESEFLQHQASQYSTLTVIIIEFWGLGLTYMALDVKTSKNPQIKTLLLREI